MHTLGCPILAAGGLKYVSYIVRILEKIDAIMIRAEATLVR